MDQLNDPAIRYARQVSFAPFGPAGQRALMRGSAAVVGVGGLGSWAAELLARAGVGRLTLIDNDRVDVSNIHRQALYTGEDARHGTAKVQAAARQLAEINGAVEVQTHQCRLEAGNAERLLGGADVIVDGTDNFAARFLINDYAVKFCRPWVFAGVLGAQAQTMAIVPPRRPCLRCILSEPPPTCGERSCRSEGVLGPAVAAVASLQAMEALKILAGQVDAVSGYLLKLDLWANTLQRIDARSAAEGVDCRCCVGRDFEYLES